MKTILDPPDENWELYQKDIERTLHNAHAYDWQFGKGICCGGQSTIEYLVEMICYERAEKRLWKNMVMEEVMERRKMKDKFKNNPDRYPNYKPIPEENYNGK